MNVNPVFTVSECVEAINHHLSLLGEIIIEGEISRLEVKNGRLIFITIKDKQSALDVFCLTHIIKNLYQLEEGMLVRVHATAGLYKGSGRFRLFASQILPQGEGALQIALEKLKNQLEKEGLFDNSHKRPLPDWPQQIGIITAKDSSAYHDLVKISAHRMGGLTLKHIPVNVQGRNAIPTILRALSYVNHYADDFDLVILTRGGGSLEDLAAFNSELVVRSVFASKVPIILAVGHEDDWSLCDYAADMRASTPSNAAEIAIRDRNEVMDNINYQFNNVLNLLQTNIHSYRNDINNDLVTINHKLSKITQTVRAQIQTFNQIFAIFINNINSIHQQINFIVSRIDLIARHFIHRSKNDISQLERVISSLNPQYVMQRGYSITVNSNEDIIRSIDQLTPHEAIKTYLSKGRFTSRITLIKGNNEQKK